MGILFESTSVTSWWPWWFLKQETHTTRPNNAVKNSEVEQVKEIPDPFEKGLTTVVASEGRDCGSARRTTTWHVVVRTTTRRTRRLL
jgi:hypothetical protein